MVYDYVSRVLHSDLDNVFKLRRLKSPTAHRQRQVDIRRGAGVQGLGEHEADVGTERARVQLLRLPAPLHRVRRRGVDQLKSNELVRIMFFFERSFYIDISEGSDLKISKLPPLQLPRLHLGRRAFGRNFQRLRQDAGSQLLHAGRRVRTNHKVRV